MTLYALLLFVLCGLVGTQNLPAQDNNFPHLASLDKVGNFVVRWNFNSSHIAFEIIANTLGYVGFGISRTGRMFPADVFVAYVKQGEVHYGVSNIFHNHSLVFSDITSLPPTPFGYGTVLSPSVQILILLKYEAKCWLHVAPCC